MSRAPVNLIAQVESPDGRVDTYTPASRDPRRVPTEVEFSTKDGVGDEMLSFVLPRGNRRMGEIESGKQMRLVGAGDYEACRGRVSGQPISTEKGITYRGLGNWQMLKDAVFPFLGIDQDWSHWSEPSMTEKLRVMAAGTDIATINWQQEGGGLLCTLPAQAVSAAATAYLWYTAPPKTYIGSIDYKGADTSLPGTATGPVMHFADVDNETNPADYSTAALTLDNTDRNVVCARAAARFAMTFLQVGSATTPTAGANRRFTTLKVKGLNPGLASLVASEILKYMLPIAAPDLKFDSDSITETTFEFGQLVQEGNLRAEDLALMLNACHLFDLGVFGYDFRFRSPLPLDDPGDYEWELSPYRGDVRDLDDDAWDENGPFNGAWVIYNNVATGGREEIVGPYGSESYLDPLGSDLLIDTSDDNPVNVNMPGRPRHAVLKMNNPTTYDIAVQCGSVFLREHAYGNRSGTFETASPWARNRAGAWEPVYKIKAQDRIKYTDSNRVHKVADTRYSTIDKLSKGSLDNPSYTLDAILERMGIQMVEVRS